MAYTTPRTWVAGEIVDKDMMNEQVRDNIAYLKNLADDNKTDIGTINNTTLKTATIQSTPGSINTPYQNGSKIRVVCAMIYNFTSQGRDVGIWVAPTAPTSPPNASNLFLNMENLKQGHQVVTFVVPPNYHYMVYAWQQNPGDVAAHLKEVDLF